MPQRLKGDVRVIDHLIAVMPDGPIRLHDWLLLLPPHVSRKTATSAAPLVVAERFATRRPGPGGYYVLTQKGQQKRLEICASLGQASALRFPPGPSV